MDTQVKQWLESNDVNVRRKVIDSGVNNGRMYAILAHSWGNDVIACVYVQVSVEEMYNLQYKRESSLVLCRVNGYAETFMSGETLIGFDDNGQSDDVLEWAYAIVQGVDKLFTPAKEGK